MKLYRKILITGIILLFIGANVIPVYADIYYSKANDEKQTAKISNNEIYNLIGGVNISCEGSEKKYFDFEWWIAEDRNFTYNVIDEMVTVNFTFLLKAYSNVFHIFPRYIFCLITMYDRGKELGEQIIKVKVKTTDVEPKETYLYIESYPIPVPTDGHQFTCFAIGLGFKIPIFNFEGDENAIPFWGSFD